MDGNLTSSLSPQRSVGWWQPGDRALNMQDVSPSFPLNSIVYFTCERYLRHTHTHTRAQKCMHAHTHIYTSLWNGTFSTICILTKGFWTPGILTGSGPSHVCWQYKFSLLRCSITFFLCECVCMCVCASPLTVPVSPLCRSFQHTHSESSQARCYFNTHFRKMNEGRFPPPPISHILIPCSLFPSHSHPSSRKSLTQYYSDIMGPLTALLK